MHHYFTKHDNVEIFSQWKANTENHFSNKRERHLSKMDKEYEIRKMANNNGDFLKHIIKIIVNNFFVGLALAV